ncbi:MAG: hypothetical protein JNL81_05970 [Hyphomonadaceae bacterium]|nr:hypothetical protein [Hyphomonadaceae bacterium]
MARSFSTAEFEAWMIAPERRAALVIAHPAHEIRILRWLSLVRPHVYILTQGSRSGADNTRRAASERLIEAHGASVAKAWAGAWDRDLYDMLLDGRYHDLLSWVDQLTADFIAREVDLVVADSWQRYNVAHDLAYVITALAAQRAREALGREVVLVTYPVVPLVMTSEASHAPLLAQFKLSSDAVAEKRSAMSQIPDIALEASAIDEAEGEEAHAAETFNAAPSLTTILNTPRETPAYEVFGEERVKAGIYTDVVRWPHVQRACEALIDAGAIATKAA